MCVMCRVLVAGVSDPDGPLLNWVSLCAICRAHIDTMPVVHAMADREPLDDEVTHDGDAVGLTMRSVAE
jgi:hypothetical protein